MKQPLQIQQDHRIASGPGERGLVSVVIPTFNRAYILGRAIESVLAQSYRPVEIIVADDGSTDGTRQLVERYGPPVRYFFQENAGVSAARNLGLSHVRGEFIALLDSDDRWLPWKLEAQVRLIESFAELGMVWTDMAAVNEAGQMLHEAFLRKFYGAFDQVRTEEIFEQSGRLADFWPAAPAEHAGRRFFAGDIFSPMILGNLVHTSTVLLRRERLRAVGGFDLSLKKAGEDYDFHLRTCRCGPVGFLDVSSIEYRIEAVDQLTAPPLLVHLARNNLRTVVRALESDRELISLSDSSIRRRLADCHEWLGREELRFGEPSRARTHLWQSLRLRPNQPRIAVLWLLSLLPTVFYRTTQRLRRFLRTHASATKILSDVATH